jgi:hypothetical protein
MADGNQLNIKSVAYFNLTFGLWHWDLNAVVPYRRSCRHTHFGSYFLDTTPEVVFIALREISNYS